jgi:hypothetical protein
MWNGNKPAPAGFFVSGKVTVQSVRVMFGYIEKVDRYGRKPSRNIVPYGKMRV